MIAGVTAHDANQAALAAIQQEWVRTDLGFAARVAHLEGGAGGLNGSTFLIATAAAGQTETVFDDGAKDTLTGGAGQDWFLFNIDGPGVMDVGTDMTSFETLYADDLDFINGN